jgi:dihydrolipoamide dehydrogenase
MEPISCTVLVLGGGPGGYVCAIRAAQLGLDTVLVESGPLGGSCLNVGCIPSKALIHAAEELHIARRLAAGSPTGIRVSDPHIDLKMTMAWKEGIVSRLRGGVYGLLRRAGIKFVSGTGILRDGKTCIVESDTGSQEIAAEHIVIATGSEVVPLPGLPFGGLVVSSTEALSFDTVPEHLVVIGGGYIGLELGTAWRKLGADVTVVEGTDRILTQYDTELTRRVMASLVKLGVQVLLNAKAIGIDRTGPALRIERHDGREQRLPPTRFSSPSVDAPG